MTNKKNNRINFSKIKFGRRPLVHDERTFELSGYLDNENLPPLPKQHHWGKKIKKDKWGVMGNFRTNLCTCAAAGHMIMTWTSNTGRLKRPDDEDIMKAYCALTNYIPETDENDEGVEALKVLKYWRKNGIAGQKIVAFARLQDKNREQLLKTIYLFGGCYVGLNLPKSAERQYNTTKKWTIPRGGKKRDAKKGSWFGHMVLVTGYKNDELRIVTWGQEMIMTIDFWEAYAEESYAVFSEAFIKHDKTPTGIAVDILENDIERLQKRKAGVNPL
ncbi:MAG TPA: hypothetical protein PKM63_04185 [Panacibacter sp.]|nr:hypothetical protein [Panacibacter sp.]HNP43458.1 hypothetical protein [Panacibacter sp.]